jgi:hypothetical protein
MPGCQGITGCKMQGNSFLLVQWELQKLYNSHYIIGKDSRTGPLNLNGMLATDV